MSEPGVPPDRVRHAFGLRGGARRLPGGRGASWLVGEVVLKPGCHPDLQRWLGTEVAGLAQDGFVLPDVLAARDGRWVVDGWGAVAAVDGVSSESGQVDWAAVLHAGRALHRVFRELDRPPWLAARTDRWARADAAAWDGAAVPVVAPLQPLVARLRPLLAPLGEDQVVHGDLTGNVLLRAGGAPAIIDISPYWRPPAYAEGIVVADALCWHRAPATLATHAGVGTAAVARGLLFRVLTSDAVQRERPDAEALGDEVRAYVRAVDVLEQQAG